MKLKTCIIKILSIWFSHILWTNIKRFGLYIIDEKDFENNLPILFTYFILLCEVRKCVHAWVN